MEKASLENIEIGNLLFGNSRGNYQIDRERWQDIFSDFLSDIEMNPTHINEELYSEFIKEERGFFCRYEEVDISKEEIEEEGVFVKDDYVSFTINDRNYTAKIYSLNDEEYEVLPMLSGEYFQKEKAFDDAEQDWIIKLSESDFDKYLRGEIKLPDSIQSLKPDPSKFQVEYVVSKRIREETSHSYFENDVFVLRPYYWGDSEEIADKPNFIFKPDNIEISWYKYPLRDAYCNKDIDDKEFKNILERCKESIKKNKEVKK